METEEAISVLRKAADLACNTMVEERDARQHAHDQAMQEERRKLVDERNSHDATKEQLKVLERQVWNLMGIKVAAEQEIAQLQAQLPPEGMAEVVANLEE